jgi:cytochrome c peroxidase
MKSRFLPCGALALLFAFVSGAAAQDQGKKIPRPRIDFETYKRVFGTDPPTSEVDNPSTPEKVALGKALYHEKHLSAGGDVSCATCHDLAKYGVDGKETSAGTGGKANERNTPTTWNSFRQFRQTWDGRAATVEDLVVPHVLEASTHGLAAPAPSSPTASRRRSPGAGMP